LVALGGAAYGASEVGEVFTAIDQIRARGSSGRAVFEVFLAWGRRLRDLADQAARHGRTPVDIEPIDIASPDLARVPPSAWARPTPYWRREAGYRARRKSSSGPLT
jgi:hypothetical protein